MIRKIANALAAFVAVALVSPLVAVAAPFAAAWWIWNEIETEP